MLEENDKNLRHNKLKRGPKLAVSIVAICFLLAVSTTLIEARDHDIEIKKLEILTAEAVLKETDGEQLSDNGILELNQESVERASREHEERIAALSIYNSSIPIPPEHQEYLYQLTKERGLDYKKTLAVMKHESVFDPSAIGATSDYGYFQVNRINHAYLSKKLGTDNKPLDPYINMNWGTYMLADHYDYWSERGLYGSELDEYVWSTYNRGLNGFRKNGKASNYIKKVREAYETIQNNWEMGE